VKIKEIFMNQFAMILLSLFQFLPDKAVAAEKYFQGYRFETSIRSNSYWESPFVEYRYSSENVIRVKEGKEYSIVVSNPLPVQVAAAVTVDGLNTIDGKRTTASEAQKWIIEPYSSITISGWQTSDSSLRKFVFTKEGASYANWKGLRDRKDYVQNLGMIGVAYFWSSAELSRVLYPPRPFASGDMEAEERGSDRNLAGRGASLSESPAKKERAGTGMGRTEWNQITRVNFYYDTGMYSSSDALLIRYEFGAPYPQPKPFEDNDSDYRYRNNYTPEMP